MDNYTVSGSSAPCLVQTHPAYPQERSSASMGSHRVTPCEHIDLSDMASGATCSEYGRLQRLVGTLSVGTLSTRKVSGVPAQNQAVTTAVHHALKAFLENDIGLCRKFVQPPNPDCDNSYAPRVIRFFPVVAGILIDALLGKRVPVTESDDGLVGDVLKDSEVKAVFFQLMDATFFGLSGSRKSMANKLLGTFKHHPDGTYDAIVDGIISHRKSLPELQVAMDRHPLTRGFPACYLPMLFGSMDDYFLGADAQNFAANTVHNLCTGFAGLLERSLRGDLQPVSLEILHQIHQLLTKDVKTWHGSSLTPTNVFGTTHLFDIPKEKFTSSGYEEMILFTHVCDQEYDEMNEISPENHPVFNIRGYVSPNDKCPGKVTVRTFSVDPVKGAIRRTKLLKKVLVDYSKALEITSEPTAVRFAIAWLTKRLMFLHYFADGNGRTIVYLINRELLRHNQPPSIILDADSITAKSATEFAHIIMEGQRRFMGIQANKYPTFFNPRIPCFYDQAEGKLLEYLGGCPRIAPDWASP
ncbi:hypothetical protein [Endozoicomonas sp. SESOKO1]|uniref:hypothetical protein n=1 Tax=Endozoicomonas sp. SESOKO1 TaxID=2828742 RepID=UPI002147F6E7|nr:hypothetical protein [Endozoicomonas sp. SESOKO1]